MTDEIPREYGRRCADCNNRVVLQSNQDVLGCACSMYDYNNEFETMPECWE